VEFPAPPTTDDGRPTTDSPTANAQQPSAEVKSPSSAIPTWQIHPAEPADRHLSRHCFPVPGTTRDAVDEVVERNGKRFRFIDTAGIRRKGKTRLMAEKLSVVMSRKHLEDADIALLVIDATEGVSSLDATIAGYAHESGRSMIILVNKWI